MAHKNNRYNYPHKTTIYGALANLTCLYTVTPVECIWNKKTKAWEAESGEFSILREGLDKGVGFIKFSSFSRVDVEIWLCGVRSSMALLGQWARSAVICNVCERQLDDETGSCVFCALTEKSNYEILSKPSA